MSVSCFLSCDWGTSYFRLRLVETESLEILAEVKTSEGVAFVSKAGLDDERALRFEKILLGHARTLFDRAGVEATVCVVSGMASSNIGWQELPYNSVPITVTASSFFTRTVATSEITVLLVSGIHTGDDVMRGEECELLGLAGLEPRLSSGSCCLILPGTHSKHIQLRDNTLAGFRTFMTGEIFAQLKECATLRAALAMDGPIVREEFFAGISTAREIGLLASFFKIRSRALVAGNGGVHGPSFLSGALIGSELLHLPQGEPVFLAAASPLGELYELGATALDVPLHIIPKETAALAPLRAHREILVSQS